MLRKRKVTITAGVVSCLAVVLVIGLGTYLGIHSSKKGSSVVGSSAAGNGRVEGGHTAVGGADAVGDGPDDAVGGGPDDAVGGGPDDAVAGSVATPEPQPDPTPTPAPDLNNGSDHRAHAVPGDGYEVWDWDNRRVDLPVAVSGRGSHTHFSDPETGEIGKLVSFEWTDKATGEVLLEKMEGEVLLPVGTHTLTLTVVDSTGDVSADDTVVEVRPTVQAGTYCNSYAMGKNDRLGKWPLTWGLSPVRSGAKPVGGAHVGSLDWTEGGLPEGLAPPSGVDSIAVHCVSTLTAGETGGTVTFAATADGPVALRANGQASAVGDTAASLEVTLAPGAVTTTEILYAPAPGAPGALAVRATGDAGLTTDLGTITPTLINATTVESQPSGGALLTVFGAGLYAHDLMVLFGGVVAPIVQSEDADETAVQVTVPPAFSGPAPITVRVGGVASNALPFVYTATAPAPVVFNGGVLKRAAGGKITFKQPTSIALGPDGRLYIGRRAGVVTVLTVDSDLAVTAVCESEPLTAFHEILGVAFNPASDAPELYVSSSILEWQQPWKDLPPTAWANGEVVTLVPVPGTTHDGSDKCLVRDRTVVSGLPVSKHDHGVNGLLFLDDGNLLISVGGVTNAGLPAKKLGWVAASPLSEAILHAAITKPSFNGTVTYDQMEDEGTARQTGGKDVRVYAAGTRNSFGMTLHSNGHVYATDNGPSDGYGGRSLTCTTASYAAEKDRDKLLDIVDGKYYGHPNRNRGRDAPIQCAFFETDAEAVPGYTPPIATFPTSTDGLVEWTLNLFPSLRGDLLASKFAPKQGAVFRVRLSPNGKGVVGDLDKHEILFPRSGVSIALHPSGVVAMPRVIRGDVLLMRSDFTPPPGAPFVSGVNPPRGRKAGGLPLTVYGWGLADVVRVTVGGKPCTEVRDVAADGRRITCTTPAGPPGAAAVVVTTAGGGASASSGAEYRYMKV